MAVRGAAVLEWTTRALMPQLPNPSGPGRPGVVGRETESPGPSEPGREGPRPPAPGVPAAAPEEPSPLKGRQPQHPGQPARYHESPGQRDEGAGE